MSSGHITSSQIRLPKVLICAARLLAVCFVVLQISIAGVAGKFAGPLPDSAALCLNSSATEATPAHPKPSPPLSHRHEGDCCFLNFGELTPGVVAVLAAYLTPPPAAMSKPSAHLFSHTIVANPELSPLSPRAPPVTRV